MFNMSVLEINVTKTTTMHTKLHFNFKFPVYTEENIHNDVNS